MTKKPMRVAVIVAPRHRSFRSDDQVHQQWVADLINDRSEAYGGRLTVTSLGCDLGFGKTVKVFCEEQGIKFFEFVVYFNGPRTKEEYGLCYQARYPSLLELGDEYYFFTTNSGQTQLNSLIASVRESGKPYYIFDAEYSLVEFKGIKDDPEGKAPAFLQPQVELLEVKE